MGGRVGPCQEDWAWEDGGGDQCNDKVGHVDVPPELAVNDS